MRSTPGAVISFCTNQNPRTEPPQSPRTRAQAPIRRPTQGGISRKKPPRTRAQVLTGRPHTGRHIAKKPPRTRVHVLIRCPPHMSAYREKTALPRVPVHCSGTDAEPESSCPVSTARNDDPPTGASSFRFLYRRMLSEQNPRPRRIPITRPEQHPRLPPSTAAALLKKAPCPSICRNMVD